MGKIISTTQELVNIMAAAKRNGQYVSVKGESDMQLRKFNTDGGPREHIKDDFQPRIEFAVTFHFGEDYEKKMSKILGEDYKAHDSNRRHIVKNVVMQYISTGNVCLIYIPNNYSRSQILLDGKKISDADLAYANRFLPKRSNSVPFEYRTLSVSNITSISINHEKYDVMIDPEFINDVDVA